MNIFITIIDGVNEGVFSTEADAMEFLDTYGANCGTPESAEIQNWIVGGGMVEEIQFAS
jgi:hypothetical protein